MDALELLRLNLFSLPMLFFALGFTLALILARVDPKDPRRSGFLLVGYWLIGLGFAGGKALATTPLPEVQGPALVALVLGLTPLLFIRPGLMITVHVTAPACAFLAAEAFTQAAQAPAEGTLASLVVFLVGAVIAVLWLAARRNPSTAAREALNELNESETVPLAMLLVGFFIGLLWPKAPEELFSKSFDELLVLLILPGALAARGLLELRRTEAFSIGLGIAISFLQGGLGVWLGGLAGLSVGGAAVLGAMAANAFYVRTSPASLSHLGLALLFNLTLGIPIYYALSRWLNG
ncbi:sodium-dependent bicarbonate transport family permease [Meiothermus taiwanensis]|uniref:Na+-dependent bicarbonate transporter superfamily protein n=2 Tax=Meiothermus taiwanensis TaxID=172827 RepID=A0A399DZ36_9DEIN|nr:sodium-dependent bicarbonate transport family permease [Meiothermus taiwanensis]AWR87023.1 hypothetical protein Mtai_v1c17890 [Meiothermus taiwanensis WR-220]KIQ54390.1 hypothetical protein SY28_08910 [Meiothermus taiwanensis]KZK14629.1 hypothetical protein A3962_03595 [Meiothermus taiwanensis]RIH77604.1 Na+-dependent bicarbonate transporter superfamily protein [Meiothermus taiwanensis]